MNISKEKDKEKFTSILLKYKEKVSKSKKFSKKFLLELGVITKNGNLKSNYKHLCTQGEME